MLAKPLFSSLSDLALTTAEKRSWMSGLMMFLILPKVPPFFFFNTGKTSSSSPTTVSGVCELQEW